MVSWVFSLTSLKASTMIASRKLSSTMNTRSSNDQKNSVAATPWRPDSILRSSLTLMSPSKMAKQVLTALPKVANFCKTDAYCTRGLAERQG